MDVTSAARFCEKRKSACLIWPFLRVAGPNPTANALLAHEHVGVCELARPEARLRHDVMTAVLDTWSAATGDAAIGLRAGAHVEAGDLGTLEFATRSCRDLREAIHCSARYIPLLDETAEISLLEFGDRALWLFAMGDGGGRSRVSNDFVVACAAKFARRYAAVTEPALEVHFMHPEPADTAPYEVFRSKLRFSMPHNGFFLPRALLDRPILHAQESLREAFEGYAREQLERMSLGVRARVAEVIRAQLASGGMSMESVASTVGASVATLRRHLEQEGTTFSALVDRIRLDLAERHLQDPRRTINEIASLVGFAHPPAFHKAFRRWTGRTPSERRVEIGSWLAQKPVASGSASESVREDCGQSTSRWFDCPTRAVALRRASCSRPVEIEERSGAGQQNPAAEHKVPGENRVTRAIHVGLRTASRGPA